MDTKEIKVELKSLFRDIFSEEPEIEELQGGGSSRKYYRLRNKEISVVGVESDDVKENHDFLSLQKCLWESGLPVPEIYGVSKDIRCYLLQDLGDESLFSLLTGADRLELSKKALEILLQFQTLSPEIWKDKVGYKPFSERLIKWDLNYFKYDFLKPAGVVFDEEALEDDFDKLTLEIISHSSLDGLMYRDFQSRNIMVNNGNLWLIDFQGARKGPMVYDAVSFIWQAKAPFSYDEREMLEDWYSEALSRITGEKRDFIEQQIAAMTVFRTLQVLGAYGFRGLIEKKRHFIESLPFAVRNLQYLDKKGLLRKYPEISRIGRKLSEKYLSANDSLHEKSNLPKIELTIKVVSYSYKKGYPVDTSGNGGGFMFDCRAIHNPGRYEKYKTLTGKDQEVIEFLDTTEEANEFVEKAVEIVIPSIERYISRGFTSLQVGFGCTGGQHRSVYCAEKFSKIIKNKYPEVSIELTHREQNYMATL